MPNLIVVVGVTGIQGSSVARTFLQLPGWRVRGISRNPSSPSAQALIAKGVEVVQGDLDGQASLLAAFAGATVIFCNADWVSHFSHALSNPDVLKGRSPNEYGFDREVEQGINAAEAAASPAVLKTLQRFVYSSLSDARRGSGGKYPNIWHNNCKIETIRVIRERFPALAERLSTVQLGHYATNWKNSPALTPQRQADGTYVIKHTFAPDFPMPFLVAHRDTGAFVKALVDLPAGKHLIGVSQLMTWTEWIHAWGETHGARAVYKQVSEEEYFDGFPEPLKNELRDTFRYVQEFGYTGGDPEVKTAEELGITVPVTSMEEYIRNEDWSSVLSV
ncbi:NAD(P)-binding protein [Aspergillus lucknowensis]|uniref:NAD(P)-binding protein n=1 Tax=Aspergillus lucknowensis TaxID=176173 RepID=A0ABR4LE32_9EURO